ncbi:hypothetical protein EV426DRAFT_702533 [Tirmania nivea]|nr:hypothetical protein EV426DRAFT_702533 [Tirmania nivea]
MLKPSETKEEVYKELLRYIQDGGDFTEVELTFKETNITHLVYMTLCLIVDNFIQSTGRKLRLRTEKEIVSTDGETGGVEESVVMDLISETDEKLQKQREVPLGRRLGNVC